MKHLTIFWFCAYDIKKGKVDIKNLLNLNYDILNHTYLVLVDRTNKEKGEFSKPIISKEKDFFIINSHFSRSHHQEFFFVSKEFKSKYILALTDNDSINYAGLVNYIYSIQKCNSNIVLAIPNCKNEKNNFFGNLQLNKLYSFWEYQNRRNVNIAYYSAIRKDLLINAIERYLLKPTKNWCHPLFDQTLIWAITRNHNNSIMTLEGFYIEYDNKNWLDVQSSLRTIKRLTDGIYLHEKSAIKELNIFNNSKNIGLYEYILWSIFLLRRNHKYYRNFSILLNLFIFLILFYISRLSFFNDRK